MIKAQNICMNYGAVVAVNNVSFEVEKGDYLVIVGQNGTGKTTLLKGLLGLLPLSSGRVEFDRDSRKSLGYLPQHTDVESDFPASAEEIVLSGRLNRHGIFAFYNKEDKLAVKKSMERLGIYEIRKKSFKELSGGQQQRILIARALCAATGILAADEPTAGLDTLITAEFYGILDELNKEGLTVITVSHDINLALKSGNKILHLADGGYFFGTKEDYLKSEYSRAFCIHGGHNV